MTKIFENVLMRGMCALVATTLLAGTAQAVSWNIPTPYPAGSFHTRNVVQFAEEITEATGGALTITVHPAGSLVKHPEIKNAVRSRQVHPRELPIRAIHARGSIPCGAARTPGRSARAAAAS